MIKTKKDLGYKNIYDSLNFLLNHPDDIFVASGLYVLRMINYPGPFDFLLPYFDRKSKILLYNLLLTIEALGLTRQFSNKIYQLTFSNDLRIKQKAKEMLKS